MPDRKEVSIVTILSMTFICCAIHCILFTHESRHWKTTFMNRLRHFLLYKDYSLFSDISMVCPRCPVLSKLKDVHVPAVDDPSGFLRRLWSLAKVSSS